MKDSGKDRRRINRVEQEVQRTIASFLISGFRSPLPGLVTVSRIIMTADLRTAKVYVSVLGSEKEAQEAVEILQDRAFEVQDHIGKELRMRFCPKLTFYIDDTTEHVLKIDRILHDLEQERTKKNSSEESE